MPAFVLTRETSVLLWRARDIDFLLVDARSGKWMVCKTRSRFV